jgi:hypothetical protein
MQHGNKKWDTQDNDIYHNGIAVILSVVMLDVANEPLMLSAIMPNVVMLSVVAPFPP